MYDVFISYSSVNQYMADAICSRMEYGGLKCWYAPRNIAVGEDWPAAIMNAIHNSRVFVLIYSANSNQSKQVIREVAAAVESECTIVPFRIDETPMCANLSYYLSGVHWMDAMNLPMEKSIENLYTRVWWMIHPPQAPQPQQTYGQPKRPVQPVPQPAPVKKKKSKLWIVLLAVAALLAVVGIIAGTAADSGQLGSGETETVPPAAEIQTISFLNLSQLGDHRYPFYNYNMFGQNKEAYFLENKETGMICCVKTDTGNPIISDFYYTPECPFLVTTVMPDSYDVVYFLEEDTALVKIYDKRNETWICEEGISMELEGPEAIHVATWNHGNTNIAGRNDDEVYIWIYDSSTEDMCYTRIVTICADGRTESKDIRHLELKEHFADIQKPGCNAAAVLDRYSNMKILDMTTMEVLDLSNESMLKDYLPYHDGNNQFISETGRYLSIRTTGETGYKLTVWDLEKQGQVISKTYTMNASSYFVGEHSWAVYNEEDNSLVLYDLLTGRAVQKLGKEYFANNAAYEELPYSFRYCEELDACVFLYQVEDTERSMVVTVTDLDGNILGQSEKLYVPFEGDCYTKIVAENNMIFMMIRVADPTTAAVDGVSTIIYRAKYTYNAQGELIFIQ